jgi:hypothetical protein
VVLAQRVHLDILDNDQLIMIFVEDRAVDQIPHVLLIPLREIEHRLRVPLRCLAQALPVRIFPDTLQNRLDGSRQLLDALVGLFRC